MGEDDADDVVCLIAIRKAAGGQWTVNGTRRRFSFCNMSTENSNGVGFVAGHYLLGAWLIKRRAAVMEGRG